ncbi:MAG: ATP-dependent DNA helicase [Bacteroidota bacterium]
MNKANFDQYYQALNPEQRQAVDRTEGPVMVVAGPGTGKTQILAVRIAKILLETDTQAHNILCLTYTDAGTIAMRQRLVQIIGPDAHRVNIYTFHALCNQVIQDNLGHFSSFRAMEPITDLERAELYKSFMRDLPSDHLLKTLKTDPQYQIRRLQNLFSLMKKESYTLSEINQAISEHLDERRNSPELLYKRAGKGFKKGDFKQKEFDKIVNKMEQLRAGAELFESFQQKMTDAGRYDYDDMLLLVAKALEDDEDLLADYQERFQYFLIDEFQDTNGTQKKIVDLLVSFWIDEPNVFVVGDDDQAIYKFQGANLGNIEDFRRQYNPHIVVLTKNYRSSQHILDASRTLIEYNKERLAAQPDFPIAKTLEAKGRYKSDDQKVLIKSYANTTQEQSSIVEEIVAAHARGDQLSEIAVLYHQHKQVEKLTEVLASKGVPLFIRRKVNILEIPLVKNLISIMTYISDTYEVKGYTDRALFELMHYPYFGLEASDITRIVWARRSQEDTDQHHAPLSTLIRSQELLEQAGVSQPRSVLRLANCLDDLVGMVSSTTLQVFFQELINRLGILDYILTQAERSWPLQVVSTLFDFIKDETTKKPDLTLNSFLTMVELMKTNAISLPVHKVSGAADGVQFITSHSSKGLEFKKVYAIGVNKNQWEGRRKNSRSFTYPPGINGDVDSNEEDERRLLFVTMTRAEQELVISYGNANEKDKKIEPSAFITEFKDHPSVQVDVVESEENRATDFQMHWLKTRTPEPVHIERELVDRRLQGFQLSVTALNKYLKCPITFYYENILKVPTARTKFMGYGRAVHKALEDIFSDVNGGKALSQEQLLSYFDMGMKGHRAHFTQDEYQDMTEYGHQQLGRYFDHRLQGPFDAKQYALEATISGVEVAGIPIKGVLDHVAIHDGYVEVTDFKTANPTNQKTKKNLKSGGEYWRQMVFYQMLCDADRSRGWHMTRGYMDFVEWDKTGEEFISVPFVISPHDIATVTDEMTTAWAAIHNYEFEQGCDDENCRWCNFMKLIRK